MREAAGLSDMGHECGGSAIGKTASRSNEEKGLAMKWCRRGPGAGWEG